MKAKKAQLLDFLKKPDQFVIPIYQRTYSWERKHCEQLWNDILRTGKDDNIPSHFIGSIVYIESDQCQVSNRHPLFVIDGQQRLTTVSLLIESLARYMGEQNKEVMDGFSEEELRHRYLINPLEKGEKSYKLLLTQTGKDSLRDLVDGKPLSEPYSLNIKTNFEFFEKKIKKLGPDVESLYKGLQKLIIVDIELNRDEDNPQLIFESMNSKGQKLRQTDLIRNFILMGLEKEHQDDLYKRHWLKMEIAFEERNYSQYSDWFIRDYLISKTSEIPKIGDVYESFKDYFYKLKQDEDFPDSLVDDIRTFANYYCAIALGKEPDKALKDAFSDLRELRVGVSYPFLLKVYDDYKNDFLSVEDFEYIIRLVESYVFRRAVCGLPPNSHNKIFAAFGRSIKEDGYLKSMKAHFLQMEGNWRFPEDEEFRREFQVRDLYNFRNKNYWLRKLENYGYGRRKERVGNEYTIEHILPQNPSPECQKALGQKWEEVEPYLHTSGNLTLTGHNSEYSNKSFPEKRDMTVGFKDSPLRLNKDLRNLETWNGNEIKARARSLAEKAITVWPRPFLSPDVLNQYC